MKMFIVCAIFLVASVSGEPVVTSDLGTFRGITQKIIDVEVESFLAIPYAKPPIGDRRFALPEAFGPVGDFDGVNKTVICPQPDVKFFDTSSYEQTEDCLILNVHRKKGTSANDKKAVIINIHGGAYVLGSGVESSFSGVAWTALGDVILVSINYRLGIFGFADMGDIAPGNLGLHDQRLAIEWVHNNIEAFGGDVNKVALVGVSAGSMSVAAQVATPLNKQPLFQSVIMDAGVINANGFLESAESSFQRIQKVAKNLDCPTDGTEMLNCLKQKSTEELFKLSWNTAGERGLPHFVATEDGKFVPRNLHQYLKQQSKNFPKIRMLVGYAKDEGISFSNNYLAFDAAFPDLKTPDEFLTHLESLSKQYDYKLDIASPFIRDKLVERYLDIYSNPRNATGQFQGDGIFICPTNYFVKNLAKHNQNIFVYRFDRLFEKGYFGMDPKIAGASHGTPYMHYSGTLLTKGVELTENDRNFFLESVETITDFVNSELAPHFRGTDWPSFSKTGEIFIFDERPKIERGLNNEENCKIFFEPSENVKTEL